MEYCCYIIFSSSIDRYYIGYTVDITNRIKLHNDGHFGSKSYTHKPSDWNLYLLIPCKTIKHAIFVESKIKRMKSRIYIENLKKYPEMVEKILKEYNEYDSIIYFYN
jgi:putative endonuclease